MGPNARACAESHDFLQDAFRQLLVELPRFQNGGLDAFVSWATTIAHHRIQSEVRRRHPEPIEALPESRAPWPRPRPVLSPPSIAVQGERAARVRLAVLQLAADQRTVIRLRQFDALSFEEIGRRMGRSANAVQLLHARAMVRLGCLLQEGVGEAS